MINSTYEPRTRKVNSELLSQIKAGAVAMVEFFAFLTLLMIIVFLKSHELVYLGSTGLCVASAFIAMGIYKLIDKYSPLKAH